MVLSSICFILRGYGHFLDSLNHKIFLTGAGGYYKAYKLVHFGLNFSWEELSKITHYDCYIQLLMAVVFW